ncbi:MAG: HAMP domain-containing histidine kinase [Bdellovibrionales bacterium]|nr:HAMP domain-containing histidine kinase [Bdellovibrionales bacterium]
MSPWSSAKANPYKFLFIPTRNRERLVEVGVRVDFIAKTLTEALGSDENLLSMSLYSPKGKPFGQFSTGDVRFNGENVTLPEKLPGHVDAGDTLKFFTKVASSHPKCCQCDVSGTSRNGEYYYVLESEVSKKELAAVQATTKQSFVLLALANVVLALVFARLLSRRLVRNIERAAKKVRKIKESGSLAERIDLKGKDEVAFLTGEFDNLLGKIQESQQKVIEAEKAEAKIQMAREVAHNIRSPAIAIEMVLPMLGRLPERLQKVLGDSAREIKVLAEKLTRQGEKRISTPADSSLICLVRDVVEKKRVEYSLASGIKIELLQGSPDDDVPVAVDPVEFRSVLSNLINNAVESYPDKTGLVEVSCYSRPPEARLVVKDFGCGMSQEMLKAVQSEHFVSSKSGGSGIGLSHAFKKIREWRGHVDVRSNLDTGTTVTVSLPLIVPNVRLNLEQKPRAANNFDLA